MSTKPKAKSRIFEAVHETASDLHRLGFIDKRKKKPPEWRFFLVFLGWSMGLEPATTGITIG